MSNNCNCKKSINIKGCQCCKNNENTITICRDNNKNDDVVYIYNGDLKIVDINTTFYQCCTNNSRNTIPPIKVEGIISNNEEDCSECSCCECGCCSNTKNKEKEYDKNFIDQLLDFIRLVLK